MPSFHATRFAALLLGILPLALNVLVFFYEIAAAAPWDCDPGPSYTARPAPGRAALGLAAFAYAFGGHGLYPEQIREMADASQWPAVMAATYAACVPLYVVCGLVGYYAYGDAAKANINLNFPDDAANRLSIAVQAVQEVLPAVCACTPSVSRLAHAPARRERWRTPQVLQASIRSCQNRNKRSSLWKAACTCGAWGVQGDL